MASFLTDLVKPYLEKLINAAITESSYICCFTCIAKDFEDEKARLEEERRTFKQRVDVATGRGEDVQANALFWEEQAEELIQEDTKTKQKCCFGFCCHCIWRYRRGKELANMKEQIKKLMETGNELAIGLPARLPDVERYSSQYYIHFKSRESKYKELLDALNDDNNYIVGLQGMGGTGKTTMIKEVGKKLKQSKQFTQVVDTTVSFSPNIKKIQEDIAGPLGLKFFDCNESDRSKKLWSRLTNGEKILLILDDVWGDIDFDEIGIPFSDNRKGCSVVVTTRNMFVCNRLGCSRIIQLDLLSEEDAWIMFQRHAGLSNVSAKNLLDKGRKIANECKRLPIAIAAIASSLKGEHRREKWDVALNTLQKHMSIDGVDENLVDIYKCLKFSYDYLKNKNAEELFLLCSVFQEDEVIHIEILTRLGIGVGLFGECYDKYNNARNLVVVAKDKLLDSCLLLKGKNGDVKMHDLIRDVAQWIANKEILVVDFSKKNKKSLIGRDNNIKYLSFLGNPLDLCSSRFDGSKLKILILNMDDTGCFVDVPDSFFENIAGLRVLNLIAKQIWLRKLSFELPQSIRLLMNLHSLLVQNVDLGDISVLGSLQSLETLDLKRCTIEELPEEFAKLKELRLLNLNCCSIKSNNPFEVIQKCPSLEELYFRNSFNNFCREITLPTLERYHLTQAYKVIYDSSVSKCVSLENDYLSEATFKHVMQTAEHFELERIKKEWRNIMPEIVPIDEGMNDLIELRLKDDSQLQCLVDTKHIVPNVFSKLVVLKLIRMKNLEELFNGPISSDSLNSLEKLTIEKCGNLRSLFKGNLNLCNLKTVEIERCSKLVSVLSPSGSLPLLEELNISNCDHLENIFTYERRVDDAIEEILLPKLKLVKIESCDKLTYIFDQQVKLSSLIELKLESVSNFKDIFPKSDHSISKPQTEMQLQVVEPIKSNIFSWSSICCYRYKLKGTTSTKVPLVVSQDKPQPCSISTETSSYLFIGWERAQCLSKIKVIKLVKVSKIKSVFVLSIAQKMSLESLSIEDCDELEHIVVDIGDGSGRNELGIKLFPKLKELNVAECGKLKYIFGHINASDDHDQNNNEIQLHFPALKSLMLMNLSSLIGLCSKQYHTTFPPLKQLNLGEFSQVDVKSISDFTFHTSVSRYQDSTIIKQFNGNMEHFLALEMLNVYDSNAESEREIDLGLQIIRLRELHMMISLFLSYLTIQECNELKHIIEEDDDDIENAMSSKTCCFPVLETLAVVKCNKLKSVFPISMRKELPELKVMLIRDADELEEIFKSVGDDDQKIEIPNLEAVGFANLPSLCHVQGIQFQEAVKIGLIHNCKKLSPVTLLTSEGIDPLYGIDGIVATLPTNSQELISEQSTSQQHSHGEIDTTSQLSQGDYLEDSQSTIPETKNVPPVHLVDLKQKGIQVSVEEGTASTSYANTITSSTHLESELMNEQSMHQQRLRNQEHPLGEIDATMKSSQVNNSEGSTSEKTQASTMPTISEPKNEPDGIKIITSSTHSKSVSSSPGLSTTSKSETSSPMKMKQTTEAMHKLVENVPDLEIPSLALLPTNSEELMDQQSMGEVDTTTKPSQGHDLEGSTLEKTVAAATLSTISGTKNEPHIQLDIVPQQKGIEIVVEEGTTSTCDKTITSSTHLEDGDGKISIPSFSTVNTKPPATKYVDIGDSQETNAMEDINKLIEEDPLLALVALEKLLTGQVSISSELRSSFTSRIEDFDGLIIRP
ncbi:disease resistance protein SUMM2 [Trifolium repens]|nr:disease resistance protein SUMM2 [Trifolium repens]